MDKRKSVLNISVSIASRTILLVAALLVRRFLIQYIGNDVNGLNSLYSSIIGMLSVAELGVGSAIVFSMYSPIVAGEKSKVAALYCLYRKLYRIIGAVIFAAGIAVMPFLPHLIKDYKSMNVNVYLTFFLTLVSVVLSYLYSAKTSLIEAYKDNYITTIILTISKIIRYALQIAAILVWRSYIFFILCQIIETILVWCMTELVVRQLHYDIISMREKLDPETKHEVGSNVKAMFMHKIGTIMVNSIDNPVISGFVGVVILGKYMNYTIIAEVISSVIVLFFSPLTSVVGHLCAAGDMKSTKSYFNFFYCMNYILGFVFFLGYFSVIDNVVNLCFGYGLEVTRAISFVITLNYFIQYMRNASMLFKDASGSFYYDRWKPIVESVVNLALSLFLVNTIPEVYRVTGVIISTIITNLLICHIVEPYVLFRHFFDESPQQYYLRNYAYIALFTLCLIFMNRLIRPCKSDIAGFFINGFISVGLSLAALVFVFAIDKEFRREVKTIGRKTMSWMRTKMVN